MNSTVTNNRLNATQTFSQFKYINWEKNITWFNKNNNNNNNNNNNKL